MRFKTERLRGSHVLVKSTEDAMGKSEWKDLFLVDHDKQSGSLLRHLLPPFGGVEDAAAELSSALNYEGFVVWKSEIPRGTSCWTWLPHCYHLCHFSD